MGTGGATALGSPEGWREMLGTGWPYALLTSEFLATRFALSLLRLKGSSSFVDQRTSVRFKRTGAGSLTSAYRSSECATSDDRLPCGHAEISHLPEDLRSLDF